MDTTSKRKQVKVAIIIPAYNAANFIKTAIESCLRQIYSNIEIIIIDDGSEDRTYDIAMWYAHWDSRIQVYEQKHKGVSAARNNGIDNCTADYLIFLDADDWLEPIAISQLVDEIVYNKKTMIAADTFYVSAESYEKKSFFYTSEKVRCAPESALLHVGDQKYKLSSSCYKLFSVEVIRENKIYFSTDIANGEDGLFVFEYLKNVEHFVYLPLALWNVLNHQDSTTRKEYHHELITALDAVNIMISYNNSFELHLELKKYLVRRIIWVLIKASSSENKDRRTVDDINELRMLLKEKQSEYLFSNDYIENKIRYIFAMWSPRCIFSWWYKSKCVRNICIFLKSYFHG